MRIREFTGADFDVLSRLLGRTWHEDHGDRSYWQGADELCEHLSHTDQGFVAEDEEGAFMGAILLGSPRAEDRNENLRMHWLQQRTRIAAMASALGINARADAAYLNEENELMKDAASKYGEDGVGEVVLFIVDEHSRGKGVGRSLLVQGLGWLERHGTSIVRLITDDSCDWQVYEHLGMEQILSRIPNCEPECCMYVYQAPIETLKKRQ